MNLVWEKVGKFGKNWVLVKIRHNDPKSAMLVDPFNYQGC